ncbi:MAG TPA: shikimate dehydrogenase [Acidimicrobiales bacterium]|nr:shikimate dehydrogenase [Acidimicrobiales bacterium]
MIGDPVRHSLSPAIHNAAFAALGLDWVYVALPVAAGRARAAIRGMEALGIEGLNVTMPHKTAAAKAVDRLTPAASALRAVNTVARVGEELVGDSTDGPGFVNALREDEGVDPAGKRFLVVGAGGAARAVVRAVAEAGAAEVVVVARRGRPASACARLAGTVGRVGTAEEAGDVDVVVNATPVGMGEVIAFPGTAPTPVDPDRLAPGQLVVDLVYEPLVTPLVAAARERGVLAVNGVGMLVHQAALAFTLWTGEEAPLPAMSAGALSVLGGSH